MAEIVEREKFVNRKWGAYQLVIYKNDRMRNWDGGNGIEIECMVCAVNFDDNIMLLQPVPKDIFQAEDFWANIDNIELMPKKPELKIIKNVSRTGKI